MCGIIAVANVKSEKRKINKIHNVMNQFWMQELLARTIERGRDATGIGLIDHEGKASILKIGWDSEAFLSKKAKSQSIAASLDWWNTHPVSIALGHCRKATKGSEFDNDNNHPIDRGNIILIHNGNVANDDDLFEKYGKGKAKRQGIVDSEALALLLEHNFNQKPFDKEEVSAAFKELEGAFGVLAVNIKFPTQFLLTRFERPLSMAYDSETGLLVVASEAKYIEGTLLQYNRFVQTLSSHKSPIPRINSMELHTFTNNDAMIVDVSKPIEGSLKEFVKQNLFSVYPSDGKRTTTTYSNNLTDKPVLGTQPGHQDRVIHGCTVLSAKEIDQILEIVVPEEVVTEASVEDTSGLKVVPKDEWELYVDARLEEMLKAVNEDNTVNPLSFLDVFLKEKQEASGTELKELDINTDVKDLIEKAYEDGLKEGGRRQIKTECDRWTLTISQQRKKIKELTEKGEGSEAYTKLKKVFKPVFDILSSGTIPSDKVIEFLAYLGNVEESFLREELKK